MWFNSVFDCLEHFRTEPIPVDGDSSEARLGDYVVKFPDASGGGFARGVSWPAGNVGMALGGILTTRMTTSTQRTTAATTAATTTTAVTATSARSSSGSNSNRNSGVQNLPEPNEVDNGITYELRPD